MKLGIKIVNRHYLIGGKYFRFEKMKSPFCKAFKVAIGKYEVRFYY
jgi:hypothetical protein